MSAKSPRDKAVLAVVAIVLLYAIAAATWFLHSDKAWKLARRHYDEASKTRVKERKLIGEKSKWEEAYETEKSQMPTFDAGKATDTAWLRKMEEIAQRNLILLGQHHASEEVSLEALVKFMHELENTEEGMFSITQLRAKPSRKPGYLSIDFTLNCAYMREN